MGFRGHFLGPKKCQKKGPCEQAGAMTQCSWPKVVVRWSWCGPVHEWRARIDFAITNEPPRYGGEDRNGAELDTQGLGRPKARGLGRGRLDGIECSAAVYRLYK